MDKKILLDLKDRKILYELDKNCRQSNSQIGRKVGLSTEVVYYRIKKLEKDGIIKQYQTIINFSKLSVLQFKICLSLKHLNSKKSSELIEELKKNNSVKWIAPCRGAFDIIISLETDSIQKIEALKNEILSLFAEYVNKKAISILVEAYVYGRNYLLSKKSIEKSEFIIKQDKIVKLDDVDIRILKKLSENARKPIIDIAEELKISVRIANYRIKRLIKEKVILGFKIELDHKKLGILFYKLFISLENTSKENIDKINKYFRNNSNIIHNVIVIGNWDLEPEFEVYSEEEFDEILSNIKDELGDIIKEIDIITISKEHKFVYF